MSLMLRLAVVCLVGCGLAGGALGADVTQLFGPGDFLSPKVRTADFESAAFNLWPITFDATTRRFLAEDASGGVTTSGRWGLSAERIHLLPLRVVLAGDVREVGMYFGNDDYDAQFNAVLTAFDASGVSLGAVSVACNRNDWVDQFIGLRAASPIGRIELEYSRPAALGITVFVDDFMAGMTVPEPGVGVLVGALGVMWLVGIVSRKR